MFNRLLGFIPQALDDIHQQPNALSEWNPGNLPAWSPVLQIQLLLVMLLTPQKITLIRASEYNRLEMNKSGAWLSATLIAIPLILLVVGMNLNTGNVDPLSPDGIVCLSLLSVSFGFAASVAVLCERPFMAFSAFMAGFFGGVITGLATALLVDSAVISVFQMQRQTLRGKLLLFFLFMAQAAGFVFAVTI